MKLKKFGALLLTGVLAITSLTTSAFAAKREKRSADDIDFAAVLEDVSAKGTVNVYHWWTAGGEKDAIESVIDEFKGAYGKVKTKSNAIPGGAGGAMVMKVKVLQQAGKSPETFQAHPGQEIQPYLDANMLLDLSKLWDYAKLNERILPGIKDLLTAPDGKNYVVPIGWLRTMAAVLLAQFFACTTSPGMAFGMMGRIFTDFGAGMTRNFPLGMQDGVVAIIAVLLMLLVDILCEKQPDLRKKLAVSPLYVRWTLLMGLMFLTLIFGCYGAGFDRAAFLYAGF